MGHLDKVYKVFLAVLEPLSDRLDGMLGKHLLLHYVVVQVVAEVVGAGGTSVAVEDAKEADLGPLNVKLGLRLGLEDV